MSSEVVALVLVFVAAIFHATWNAVLKTGGDRLLTTAVLAGTGSFIAIPLVILLPSPPPEAWPFIFGSVALHLGYYVLLPIAYTHGDLGFVYPIARGTGPVLVAASSGVVIGETLGPNELAGVGLISVGIMTLAFERKKGGGLALVIALVTGLIIGAYTINDGIGIRRAGDAALGYIAWIHLLDPLPVIVVALIVRRRTVGAFLRTNGLRAAGGGLLAFVAAALALYAMTLHRVAPIAALRETSVIFAAILGSWILKEPFGRRRILAASLVAIGAALLNL